MFIPTNCPCCDSDLTRVKDQLFCFNEECPAQTIGRLKHFAKSMKIKGLGEVTIDLLALDSITTIYELTESEIVGVIGEALGKKLFAEIENSKQAPIDVLITSLSIPSIGEVSSRKLYKSNKNFWELTAADCRACGLGEVSTGKLISWIENNKNYKQLPFNFILSSSSSTSGGKGIVCITGKLKDFKNRSDAKSYLESFGYTVVDSVTKTVNFLVNETGEVSSKTDKAAKYGIPTVTIQNLTTDNC